MKKFLLVLLVILPLAGAGAWWGWEFIHQEEKNQLSTVKVMRGNLEERVTAIGTIKPKIDVEVGAQISGQLTKIYVEVGDQVEEGQLLAEIDTEVLQAKVTASKAQIQAQKAQLKDRRAQLTLAQQRYRRQQNLYKNQAVTQEDLQQAEANFLSAQAQVEQLVAQIQQNEASLQAEEANLKYGRITAPISGTVVSLPARQGQTLNANQQAPVILTLADLSTMRVETEVSEADISRLSVGMPAFFTTLGNQNRRWQGELLRIDPTPQVQNNVVLYNAPFDVKNKNNQLLPQMTAQVFFVVAKADNALIAPLAALQRQPRGVYLAKVKTANGIEERQVKLGVNNRIEAEVISGLNEGDELVLAAVKSATRPSSPMGSPMRMR